MGFSKDVKNVFANHGHDQQDEDFSAGPQSYRDMSVVFNWADGELMVKVGSGVLQGTMTVMDIFHHSVDTVAGQPKVEATFSEGQSEQGRQISPRLVAGDWLFREDLAYCDGTAHSFDGEVGVQVRARDLRVTSVYDLRLHYFQGQREGKSSQGGIRRVWRVLHQRDGGPYLSRGVVHDIGHCLFDQEGSHDAQHGNENGEVGLWGCSSSRQGRRGIRTC